MDSRTLKQFGFKEWLKISKDKDKNRELILKLPRKKGVYVIRANRCIPRLKGESDIIYIGEGTIQYRVQQLLEKFLPVNFRSDYKHTASEEIERILNETDLKLEVSYVTIDIEKHVAKILESIFPSFFRFNEKELAKELERILLKLYCSDHIELPPLNRRKG